VRGMWRLAVPLVFAMAGILFATSAGASKGGDLRGGSRSDLPDLIRAEEHRVAQTTQVVERLRGEVQLATADLARADQRIGAAQKRASGLSLAAGMGPVEGSGLTVTLSDAPRAADRLLPEGTSPDDLVVHQQDVQAVVNAMWAGGAEAMQIMDQRVISTSAVRCVGNTLILQGRVYSPPYVVTALGDPDRMELALDSAENVQLFRYYADRYGLVYKTAHHRNTRLPGYAGPLDLLYAKAPE
jgi:uncharacterized protein YlxW (UPF0749 family)